MDRVETRIEHGEPVGAEQRLNSLKRIVEQMLMINLIERQILHDAFHIEKLHDENAIRFQTPLDGLADGMQLLEMKENAGSVADIKSTADCLHCLQVEESV